MTAASTLKAKLRHDLTEAIRSQDKVTSAALRMALSSISTEETAGTVHRELSDEDVVGVLTREAKRRREAATAFTGAGRQELADRELAELAVLQGYLPPQLDDAELEALATQAVTEVGATGMAQMGQVMRLLQPQVAGRAEGGRVAAAVKRALGV